MLGKDPLCEFKDLRGSEAAVHCAFISIKVMTNKRVADMLVDVLVAAGVKNVYGLAGDSLNGITDSIRTRNNTEWVPVRHEETAAFAAGAEAHLTGHLSVCAGSCGP